ncbi:uncharacterized protein K460DRAFT_279170 [Cucurbitaria berberidis CBS 394.84]|uniref:Uncharacterized protein n=1 Tax=Cucurbitaria berberidis CBS 394.84 TaxID=1168544 RepID=A0A9P4GPD6_9PLEO|nr:uncharacterized protein K460DRAFT_279170 [Cucurbitaria berberidis CBS 394.84]KAF1849134.1 hypothetical protein K460DRAFT_279170 [Cucurbitaria berberidis CBS 394.84]
MDDYERVAKLQEEADELRQTVQEQGKELSKLQGVHADTVANLQSCEKQVADKDLEIASLQGSNNKLKKDVEHEKEATTNLESILKDSHHKLDHASDARQAAIKAKDEAEAREHDTQLQFDDLRKQWEEAQSKIEELERQVDAIQELEHENAGLMDDIDNLRDELEDHHRTLIVKDERIGHLETQFQKERQRNLNAADAADAAAARAGSPADELPTPFSPLGESLQDELEASSDYDGSLYEPFEEPHELSPVTEIASITPVEAVSAPTLTLDVDEAASIAPFEPVSAPTLTLDVGEAASVAPFEPVSAPTLTLDVHEAASVAPIQTAVPAFSVHVDETASITPLERQITTTTSFTQTEAHELTTEIPQHAALDIAPVAPIEVTSVTTSTQTAAPKLTASIIDSASIDVPSIEALKTEREVTVTTATQTAISNPKITLTPMLVTHEEWPLAEYVPKRPTSSAGAQTTEIELAAPTPEKLGSFDRDFLHASTLLMLAHKAKEFGTFDRVPRLASILATVFAAFLTYMYLSQYIELQAWKTANGVGFRQGYGNMYNRGGAYGNGRYLFGLVPVAMDVGNSGWSEQLARTMSMAITSFENWAGITHSPLY